MKLEDDFEESKSNSRFSNLAIGISILAVLAVVIVVLVSNRDLIKRKFSGSNSSVPAGEVTQSYQEEGSSGTQTSGTYESTGLRVSDLDFYDMYPETGDPSETVQTDDGAGPEETEEELTDATDGKHTLVTDYDGTEEWVAISQYLTRHDYDFTCLYDQAGIKKYFSDNKCVSTFGVDVSKEQGYIDYVKLKKAGCDFVMIRLGARGYETGQLVIDEYFKDNLKRATDAGLDAGVYFISQAISKDEAVEEANLVLENIKDYTVRYPVAFVMQYQKNDSSRVETLSRNDKSMIARTFLNTIKDAGYNTILYGDKTWLIKYVDLSKLISDFDIWLSEPDVDIPDYPYKFAMWQYDTEGTIDGISGTVNFNICFVDYSLK